MGQFLETVHPPLHTFKLPLTSPCERGITSAANRLQACFHGRKRVVVSLVASADLDGDPVHQTHQLLEGHESGVSHRVRDRRDGGRSANVDDGGGRADTLSTAVIGRGSHEEERFCSRRSLSNRFLSKQ